MSVDRPAVVDTDQRQQALDPARSFCVAAPAGSGKTEILIQRFLRLLANVDKPEEVLAITFTRKAAAEMRERILLALDEASDNRDCDEGHQKLTRSLADAVLTIDAQKKWNLRNNPARLRITTIDSFCAGITRQMPILSSFGSQPTVVDDPFPFYRQASQDMLSLLESRSAVAADIATLLDCFDNDWQKLESLLVQMLARRDQWLMHMGIKDDPEGAQTLVRQTLQHLVEDQLKRATQCIEGLWPELQELINIAVTNLEETDPDADIAQGGEFQTCPRASVSELGQWRRICTLLMTAEDKWRKTVDKRQGFPPAEKASKQRLLALIGEIAQRESSLELFRNVAMLPDATLENKEWRLIGALSHVLPVLAAQLFVIFQQHGSVDYCQISMSALDALGDEFEPTELGLKFDYRISHILVDEFQDTAISQYKLLHRLTAGWQEYNNSNPDSPNTLFIVGDGMQSIYGFRDANVGLFVQAQQYGMNGIHLQNLFLETNFRSDENIVGWVNDTFAKAFPKEANIERGDIDFRSAVAHRKSSSEQAVNLRGFCGETARLMEADHVCDVVRDAVARDDCDSIAILVRSRSHLIEILPRLADAGIGWLAHDIDPLIHRPAIIDLLSLCRALVNPAERIAWLALLRSPLVGLDLTDIHQIAAGANGLGRKQSIRWRLMQTAIFDGLGVDGAKRVRRLQAVLLAADKTKERKSLRSWVESIWLAMGGPGTLNRSSERDDVQVFFGLLEEIEQQGFNFSTQILQRRVDKLFASGSSDSDCKVHVMTIHKAKGLEFDWVVLPALGRRPAGDDKQLLVWQEYSNDQGFNGLLLAAMAENDSKKPTLYNYLHKDKGRRTQVETTRLLYVAATRAVKKLYLSAEVKYDEVQEQYKPPVTRSLLEPIWQAFAEQADFVLDQCQSNDIADNSEFEGLLRSRPRVVADWVMPTLPQTGILIPTIDQDPGLAETENVLNRPEPEPGRDRDARLAGLAAHSVLEYLSQLPIEAQKQLDLVSCRQVLASALLRLGVSDARMEDMQLRVEGALKPMLDDSVGQWILSAGHESAVCEYEMTQQMSNGQFRQLVVDRSFVYEGQRWIIDYKTSTPNADESLAEFIHREADEYEGQLRTYQRVMATMEDMPSRIALYFTAVAKLYEYPICS
ncbi:UvrD-helicase domain-containing protein [Halieaceae bacterium]|nr:UvrD-helicase domain-containing protein [Halieaceae bacterium]